MESGNQYDGLEDYFLCANIEDEDLPWGYQSAQLVDKHGMQKWDILRSRLKRIWQTH